MQFDKNIYYKLGSGERTKLLLGFWRILSLVLALLSAVSFGVFYFLNAKFPGLLAKYTILPIIAKLSPLFIALAVLFLVIGIKPLFKRSEEKIKRVTSASYKKWLKEYKSAGGKMTKDQSRRYRFDNDPLYQEKVMESIKRKKNSAYSKNLRDLQKRQSKLETDRDKLIEKKKDARWIYCADKRIGVNATEGTLTFNGEFFENKQIGFAELNIGEAYRVSEKKTKEGVKTENIPTCSHVGVRVSMDGLWKEIVFLDKTVDKSDKKYLAADKLAREALLKLEQLRDTPMPTNWTPVDGESDVLELNKQIAKVEMELDTAKRNLPTYEVPEKYRPIMIAPELPQQQKPAPAPAFIPAPAPVAEESAMVEPPIEPEPLSGYDISAEAEFAEDEAYIPTLSLTPTIDEEEPTIELTLTTSQEEEEEVVPELTLPAADEEEETLPKLSLAAFQEEDEETFPELTLTPLEEEEEIPASELTIDSNEEQ